jgi:hypothetical protein
MLYVNWIRFAQSGGHKIDEDLSKPVEDLTESLLNKRDVVLTFD